MAAPYGRLRVDREEGELRARLRSEFAEVDAGVIDRLAAAAWSSASESRVKQFRVILAEREVRAALRRRNGYQPAGGH